MASSYGLHRRRACSLVITLMLAVRMTGNAQIGYSYTDFLHGFASSGRIWTNGSPYLTYYSPLQYLSRTLDLATARAPSFDAGLNVAQWREQYAPTLTS